MSEQFKGLVNILNDEDVETITLDANKGEIHIKYNQEKRLRWAGKSFGNFQLWDSKSRQTCSLNANTGSLSLGAIGNAGNIFLFDKNGHRVLSCDGKESTITIGAKGNASKLIIKDEDGKLAFKFVTDKGVFGNQHDISIYDDKENLSLLFSSFLNLLSIYGKEGKTTLSFNGKMATLIVGNEGNAGHLVIQDGSNKKILEIGPEGFKLNAGICAESNEPTAVYAYSDKLHGVHAHSNSTSAVYAYSVPGAGVHAHSENGTAVYAYSDKLHGVHAHSNSTSAVYAYSVPGAGVHAHSINGTAVYAYSEQGWGLHARGAPLAGFFEGSVEVTGDVILTGADCAEDFELVATQEVGPGTVMVLDSGERIRQSTQAYDKKVAGVISGAGDCKPGMVLGRQPGKNHCMPVALMGKVYCKVDAHYGPIEVGDLLTTSDTPGHAMKAVDPMRSFGAVIGKALKPLSAGLGLIPILIALQ
jgi:hypothetical protein